MMIKLIRRIGVFFLIFLAFLIIDTPVLANKNDISINTSGLPNNIPWDLNKLYKAPGYKLLDNTSVIRPLMYEGLPYNGKPTRVLAYYSTPGLLIGNKSIDKNLPAVVLVHPGWGYADAGWVEMWARRGYAAIAMDLEGQGPNQTLLIDGGPPRRQYMNDVWNYHAIAKIILAHSLILGFPEVDKNRTAITGVSVGGHLTCSVAGLDRRFKAAVPVYGCAYIHKIDQWKNSDLYTNLSNEQKKDWNNRFDPSNYIKYAQTPMLFIGILNDDYYPMNFLLKTYNLCPAPKKLIIDPNLKHNWPDAKIKKEVFEFIDYYINSGEILPSFKSVKIVNNEIRGLIDKGTWLKATLYYTTDTCTWEKRKWNRFDARIDKSLVIAPVPPKNFTAWFITAIDSKKREISSIPQVFNN